MTPERWAGEVRTAKLKMPGATGSSFAQGLTSFQVRLAIDFYVDGPVDLDLLGG